MIDKHWCRWDEHDCEAAYEEIERLLALVNEQAEDEGLWFRAETCAEAYVQQALRRLHAAIEGRSPEECARRALEPKP